MLSQMSGKESLVYKCVADPNFESWMKMTSQDHRHNAINLVGRATSDGKYEGPSLPEAMQMVAQESSLDFGCVCIAERHTIEAAEKRGKTYPTEHENMLRKQNAGCKWFISQAIYDPEPTIRLLKDYGAICRQNRMVPCKVVLTFTPVSRTKTMQFVKWLGVSVPEEAEQMILSAEKPVDASVDFLCEQLKKILAETEGCGVPLGISCESVSIYKAEIDGVHDLFRKLQCILLDTRGSSWKVQWNDVCTQPAQQQPLHENSKALPPQVSSVLATPVSPMSAVVGPMAVGALLVAVGVILGSLTSRRS